LPPEITDDVNCGVSGKAQAKASRIFIPHGVFVLM